MTTARKLQPYTVILCTHCKVELTDENGYRIKRGPEAGKLKNLCRSCGKKASRLWAHENPERHAAQTRNWDLKNPEKRTLISRRWIHEFRGRLNTLKQERPCYDCGATPPPECLDFDHVSGIKLFNVSAMAGKPWELVREEIDKCQLVCACCHRIRTQQRFQNP